MSSLAIRLLFLQFSKFCQFHEEKNITFWENHSVNNILYIKSSQETKKCRRTWHIGPGDPTENIWFGKWDEK
jgi:hypothetical protein